MIVEQVPAWTSNRLKRLTRRPKRYLIDPALIAATLTLDVAGIMRDGDLLGRVLDSVVADLVAELAGGRLIGVEVKAGGGATPDDARHLAWLRDEIGDEFAAGAVLHTGPSTYELGERIVAAPICSLWG